MRVYSVDELEACVKFSSDKLKLVDDELERASMGCTGILHRSVFRDLTDDTLWGVTYDEVRDGFWWGADYVECYEVEQYTENVVMYREASDASDTTATTADTCREGVE